jgi:hypothetical protein
MIALERALRIGENEAPHEGEEFIEQLIQSGRRLDEVSREGKGHAV